MSSVGEYAGDLSPGLDSYGRSFRLKIVKCPLEPNLHNLPSKKQNSQSVPPYAHINRIVSDRKMSIRGVSEDKHTQSKSIKSRSGARWHPN